MPFGLVLLEPVRSAEPPSISGNAAVMASSALSDALRVAISLGAAASFSFTARTAAAIVSIDAQRRPAGCLEPAHLVDRIGKGERPIDRDSVVVEQHDELVELEVPGKCDRLLAHSLHEIAVGGEHIGMMVHDRMAEYRGK